MCIRPSETQFGDAFVTVILTGLINWGVTSVLGIIPYLGAILGFVIACLIYVGMIQSCMEASLGKAVFCAITSFGVTLMSTLATIWVVAGAVTLWFRCFG